MPKSPAAEHPANEVVLAWAVRHKASRNPQALPAGPGFYCGRCRSCRLKIEHLC